MKRQVYIETSVIGYLTGRPNRDVVIAAHQELTRQWWETRSPAFDLLVSELVREEAGRGDAEASAKRLTVIAKIPILQVNDLAVSIAAELVSAGPIPRESVADALHISIAAVNGVDYLLTWNCKHLANAQIVRIISLVCTRLGQRIPVICTPEELMGE